MSWLDDYMKMMKTDKDEATRSCPGCGESCPIVKCEKVNHNYGREYISCKGCGTFEWLDMPECKSCRRSLFTARAKASGRRFQSCPNKCAGSFEWLDKED